MKNIIISPLNCRCFVNSTATATHNQMYFTDVHFIPIHHTNHHTLLPLYKKTTITYALKLKVGSKWLGRCIGR